MVVGKSSPVHPPTVVGAAHHHYFPRAGQGKAQKGHRNSIQVREDYIQPSPLSVSRSCWAGGVRVGHAPCRGRGPTRAIGRAPNLRARPSTVAARRAGGGEPKRARSNLTPIRIPGCPRPLRPVMSGPASSPTASFMRKYGGPAHPRKRVRTTLRVFHEQRLARQAGLGQDPVGPRYMTTEVGVGLPGAVRGGNGADAFGARVAATGLRRHRILAHHGSLHIRLSRRITIL